MGNGLSVSGRARGPVSCGNAGFPQLDEVPLSGSRITCPRVGVDILKLGVVI